MMLWKKRLQFFYHAEALLRSCSSGGYDPYDGLNSRFFQKLPLLPKSRLAVLIWIQAKRPLSIWERWWASGRNTILKRSDFSSAYCWYVPARWPKRIFDKMSFFISRLKTVNRRAIRVHPGVIISIGNQEHFSKPKYTPTIVASSFIVNAILDAYEITRNEKLLKTRTQHLWFHFKRPEQNAWQRRYIRILLFTTW